MAYWPNPRRRLTIAGQPAASRFGGGGMGGGGMGGEGPVFEDPYGTGTGEPDFQPIDYGPEGIGGGPLEVPEGGVNYGPSGGAPETNPGYPGIRQTPVPGDLGAGSGRSGDDGSYIPGGGYSPPGGSGGGYGPLSFQAGLGVSALSGLFSALGGILAAQEAGSQLRKLKQTPANKPGDLAATTRGRFAPPTSYAPQYRESSSQPVFGSPDAKRQAMGGQVQSKLESLLTQVGSPQLKASRFGVGGF